MAKRITTIHEELEPNNDDELVAYYRVILRGLCQHMTADTVIAHFGTFDRVERGLVEYSSTVWAEKGEIYHDYHSEFLDDLSYLQEN